MKIAILASNRKPIPSPSDMIFAPGMVIYELTEGLVKKGHDVTLFAPEGTKTSAKLITAGTKSLYEEFSNGQNFQEKRAADIERYVVEDTQYELLMASTAFKYIKENNFDIVHAHKTRHEIYFTDFVNTPCLFTFHSPPGWENSHHSDTLRLKKYAKFVYFTSLSDAQRKGLEFLNFVETVYNGVDVNNFQFSKGGREMLFVGRIEKKKGIETAIQIAQETNLPLSIIGDVVQGKEGLETYQKVKPLIDGRKIKYYGHIRFDKVSQFYRKAKLLLFPSREEAMPLSVLEAMATGLPVVSSAIDGLNEVINDSITGFICPANDINAMAQAVSKIYAMPEAEYKKMRQNCRKHVEENFTVEKMVDGYEKVYQKVIEDWKKKHG